MNWAYVRRILVLRLYHEAGATPGPSHLLLHGVLRSSLVAVLSLCHLPLRHGIRDGEALLHRRGFEALRVLLEKRHRRRQLHVLVCRLRREGEER